MSKLTKVEPIPGTQDVYLDAPRGELQPPTSTPGGMDSELSGGLTQVFTHSKARTEDELERELEGIGRYGDREIGRSGESAIEPVGTALQLRELEEQEERAHDRKADSRDVETALMLHEVNLAKSRPYLWHKQERWAKQYEEERMGRIIHSRAFIKMMAGVGVELRANEYGRLGRIGINALACPACKSGPLADCPDTCTGRGFVYKDHQVDSGIKCPHCPRKGFSVLSFKVHLKQHKLFPMQIRDVIKKVKTDKKKITLAQRGERSFDWMTLATLHNGATPEYSVMRFDEYGIPTNEKFHGWRTALLDLMFAGVVTRAQAEKAFGKVERVSPATEFYLAQLAMVKW